MSFHDFSMRFMAFSLYSHRTWIPFDRLAKKFKSIGTQYFTFCSESFGNKISRTVKQQANRGI